MQVEWNRMSKGRNVDALFVTSMMSHAAVEVQRKFVWEKHAEIRERRGCTIRTGSRKILRARESYLTKAGALARW